MFGLARRLTANGVLGINRRNAEYMLPYNKRTQFPLVDDKVLTKSIAVKAGAAVPELYGTIEIQRDIREFSRIVEDREDFVVKPAEGSQGKGIIVVTGRAAQEFILPDGASTSVAEMGFHISNILSGIYSLGGQPDKAIVEYRVKFDPVFRQITFRGVPDIRIIVFFGIPVMAMVRLPTRRSSGKANLHQGAVGAGINIATGRTLTAVQGNAIVDVHPDTRNPVSGVQIPQWDRLLDIAARSYEMTGLGYQGIDLVLDRDLGPLILELNARPGLNIQIASRAGLVPRLELALRSWRSLSTVGERVAFARQNFAHAADISAH